MVEYRQSDAFDRRTGAQIDTWDLFTAPRETVIKTILEESSLTDPSLLAGKNILKNCFKKLFYNNAALCLTTDGIVSIFANFVESSFWFFFFPRKRTIKQ